MALTNSQYDAIMRVYDSRRLDHRHEEAARKAQAYAKIPELKELDRELVSAHMQRAMRLLEEGAEASGHAAPAAAAAGRPADSEETAGKAGVRETASGTLQAKPGRMPETDSASGTTPASPADVRYDERRRALLEAHGFSGDYLDPIVSCRDCGDTGLLPDGSHCHCFRREVVRMFYNDARLGDVLEKENFSHFDAGCYPADLIVNKKTGESARAHMERTAQICRHFAAHFDEEGGNLLFYGNPGLGKTFLSRCIAKELIDSGHSVIYYSAGELFDRMADDAFGRGEKTDGAADGGAAGSLSYLGTCDLLIIDDLGTELTNAFVGTALFRILSQRLGAGRSTLISTNLSLGEISGIYSERISSRLMESFTLLPFYGRDIRIRNKLAQAAQAGAGADAEKAE